MDRPGSVTSEELDSMSTAGLLELLERMNEDMTDESFDGELVSACLDAIDRRCPMPEHPSAEESLRAFEARLGVRTGGEGSAAARPGRRLVRLGLAAAVLAACLFAGMIAAQAAGVDVFGAVARWTDSLFRFDAGADETQRPLDVIEAWLPEPPEGFSPGEPTVMTDERAGTVYYCLEYSSAEGVLVFDALSGMNSTYEKDGRPVKTLEVGGVPFYLFTNNGTYAAVWSVGTLEFSLMTDVGGELLEETIVRSYMK